MTKTTFQLEIIQLGNTCHFKLSGERGLTIATQLDYPAAITQLYTQWRKSYLSYYQRLRGKVEGSGVARLKNIDWRGDLVQAEAKLLDQFHYWLLSHELHPITRKIAQASLAEDCQRVEIFITCNSKELARLPWETWEIGTHLGTKGKIYIARSPANISNESVHSIHRKPRILAIFGDDTGLDLKKDKEELESLFGKDVITFVGWKQGDKNCDDLKHEIVREIADEKGWDILFFAGHSNEGLGGELSIAPNTSIFIREIEPALKIAKEKGLQFAIFNSCSGIDLAQSLIDLGLNQVIVFREPIHNQVAQEFSKQFFRSLAQYKDVNESMVDACQFLKQQEKVLTYPSAYSIPSLFRHPEAELFRLQPKGWKRWLPSRLEIVALGSVLALSILPPLQDGLLGIRLTTQATYRYATQQVGFQKRAPVLLVQIDEASRLKDPRLREISPIDYSYLGDLLNKLSKLEPKTIGIDYVLNREKEQTENTNKLRKVIENTVNKDILLVFAADEFTGKDAGVSPQIADLNRTMQGDIYFFPGYIELLPHGKDCIETCPFAYLLAIAHQLKQESFDLQSQAQQSLRTSVANYLDNAKDLDEKTAFLHRLRLPIFPSFALWLRPIVDFSLPPNQSYERISAHKLLEGDIPPRIGQQVVLVAPGGYGEAGLYEEGSDNFPIPLALNFRVKQFTGGEYHAYMLHHLLTQRLVVPISNFWMVLLAALLGKGAMLMLIGNPHQRKQWIVVLYGATTVYMVMALQAYISVAVLLPCVFPLAVFWTYIHFSSNTEKFQ
ncbi:CHASE2 domain-containing protein [Lusitaniella coriacea]|uniref:CHASE2 domain-containing protein n=1 Tax=Lusitaniella coriacea TaxID=1983105 RepID=UPI003CF162C2